MRGKRIRVLRTDLTPESAPWALEEHNLVINNSTESIAFKKDDELGAYILSIWATSPAQYGVMYGENYWFIPSGYEFIVPNDQDYIVTSNDLPTGSDTYWGFENMLIYD